MTVSAQINKLQYKDFLKICYIKGVDLIVVFVKGGGPTVSKGVENFPGS